MRPRGRVCGAPRPLGVTVGCLPSSLCFLDLALLFCRQLSAQFSVSCNDRFRQPNGMFLVKKNGKFGAINVADNRREKMVLPLEFNDMNFWWSPESGTLIEASRDGKHRGLYKLDASKSIPERYNEFIYQTPFRKAFVLAA